jgi:RNA polymerase sigma factor (sigma-70 family)
MTADPSGAPPTPDPTEAATDHSLLAQFKAGEAGAADELYKRYADHLRALTKAQSGAALSARMDPDDIVQSVFRTFFRRAAADGYDVPRGDDLWRLFLVIALHKIRNAAAHHRAAKRDVRQTVHLGDVPAGGLGGGGVTPDDTDETVLRMVVADALAALPASSRRMVELRIDGHEVADIAAATGRSKRSVERVLQQFRDQLGVLLHDD